MLFRFQAVEPIILSTTRSFHFQTRCYSSQKSFDPLRILFCGADEFSIYSLRRLHALKESRPECIASIDVVCRPDKPVGRKRQQVREVPIKSTAQTLGLTLHQIDTFRNWTPPPTDLVVTVSFGLLVPARILNSAKYGGLNIHPSLLPDLRGPAPIQHALLQGRKQTGVSLQTMHPTKFDNGAILAQRTADLPGDATVESTVEQLGPIGAEMLAFEIEDGIFVEPENIDTAAVTEGKTIRHAPKITPEDREVTDWTAVTAEDILRRDRVLGRLWDQMIYAVCFPGEKKRITFHDGWTQYAVENVDFVHKLGWASRQNVNAGGVVVFRVPGAKGLRFGVQLADEKVLISPNEATIEGERKGTGVQALTNAIKAREKAINAGTESE